MTLAVILLCVLCLAYANGANDNFKGVATLFGSGTAHYRGALLWATATTFLGSVTAVFLAERLLRAFSGKGIVGAELAGTPAYGAAVALGAGATVLLATRWGLPISTTHSLVGALVGAGWAASAEIHLQHLGAKFFLPLLVSPVMAVVCTVALYYIFRRLRRWSGITEQTCFCIGQETVEVVPLLSQSAALKRVEQLTAKVGTTVQCHNQYSGCVLGVEAAPTLDKLHYLSAGAVSFARGLNDTPKIAALLLLAPAIGGISGTALVAVVMAAGGLLSARKVAETMSQKITSMNHGQGLTGNLVTALIVIGASRLGMPVSTTHVSCGSMFGIGAVTKQAHWSTIGKILTAWITTLPLGAALGFASYWVLHSTS